MIRTASSTATPRQNPANNGPTGGSLFDAHPGSEFDARQHLEFVSRLLGTKSHHDLRQQAKDNEHRELSRDEMDRLIQKEAVSNGEKFPRKLDGRLGKTWQRSAVALFDQAVSLRSPGELEFVALVGSEASGKTVLAKHVCMQRGGLVLDVGFAIQFGTEKKRNPEEGFKKGSVLVYDQPAVLPERGFMPVGDTNLWCPGATEVPTLEAYRQARRYVRYGIPHDESIYGIRDWVTENGDVTLVVCFASCAKAEEAVKHSAIIRQTGDVKRSASKNWRRAHVVDLDTMTYSVVDGPGLQMEQGTYKPTR